MRKTISIILSVLMILSSFSIITTISAKETNVSSTGESYSGTTGDCTWMYDEDTETLTISGNGKMRDYSYNNDTPWKQYYDFGDSISEIIIEDGVTSIGNLAFYGCSSLTSITIPDSVTSIGIHAFDGCSKLTSITIPDSVISIGYYAFYGCSSLTSITIPDSVTSIDNGAFENCSSLTSITIPNSVTSIGFRAFGGCSSLTSITIPNSVTTIDSGAFGGCSSLTSITIPNSVTSISNSAFGGCSSLTSITIPNSVTTIDSGAFGGCSSLTSITIPDSVTSIGWNAFNGCSSLTSITIPNSVTSIGDFAFSECTQLEEVTIPTSVTTVGKNTFSKCANIKDVYYAGNRRQFEEISNIYKNSVIKNSTLHFANTKDSGTTGDCTWSFDESTETLTISGNGEMDEYDQSLDYYTPWYSYSPIIKTIVIKDGVTSIGDDAFYNCSSLTSITIPNSVKSIGSYAFNSTSKLSDIYYSGNYSSWKNISIDSSNSALNKATLHCGLVKDSGTIGGCTWSFDGDTGILNISGNGDMPSYSDTDDIPWYGYRESITKVNIEDGVTSIGMGDFYNCPNLTNVSIPDSVKTIGKNSFAYCSNLVDISLPDNLECIVEGAFYDTGYYKDENNWKNGVLYIGKYLIVANNVGKNCIIKDGTRLIANSAFAVQRNLARIAMPDTLEIIGESAFSDCTNLAGVSIPNSVKVIGTMAFNNCTGLESIVIPSNVETIGEEAFSGCSGLTGVAISEGVKNIGKSAFKSCSIKNLTIPSSMETIGESAFASNILVNVVILEGITSINNSVFYQCTSLESIDIPVSVKSIGESAFAACRSLSTVNYFGNKKQWSLITVEKNNDKLKDANIQYGLLTDSGETGDCQWAFDGETGTMTITGNGKMEDYEDSANVPWILYASDIKTVIIDDGVTKIGDFSFADNCKNITDVTIANTVTDIGLWAFDGCDSIENVYYKGLENQWNTVKIRDYNDSIVNANIHFATVKKVAKVTVNKKSVVLVKGRTTTVKATVSPTNASNKKLKWTTSNSKVAVVNSQGKITAKGRGNATIKVMALDGSNKYATVKVTVKQPVTSVKLNKKSATLKVKGNAKQKTVTLKATVNPKNANNKAVTWKSSNTRIATVNSKGKVIAKKKGTCYIIVTAKDGSKKSAKCKIVVK